LACPICTGGIYTASKHAVLGLSDVLRQELPEHVKVSVLFSGAVPSRLTEAVRNRPDRFGGAMPAASANLPDGLGMPADEVGRRVVAGVAAGDFHIMTHGPVREMVDERYEEMRAAFEKQAPRFEDDGYLNTREMFRVATRKRSPVDSFDGRVRSHHRWRRTPVR